MSFSRAAIDLELRGEVPITSDDFRAARARAIGPEWMDVRDAVKHLRITVESLSQARSADVELRDAIAWRPNSTKAKSPRNVGLLLLRADVERLAGIRRRCRISLADSLRVLAALKNGGPL